MGKKLSAEERLRLSQKILSNSLLQKKFDKVWSEAEIIAAMSPPRSSIEPFDISDSFLFSRSFHGQQDSTNLRNLEPFLYRRQTEFLRISEAFDWHGSWSLNLFDLIRNVYSQGVSL